MKSGTRSTALIGALAGIAVGVAGVGAARVVARERDVRAAASKVAS